MASMMTNLWQRLTRRRVKPFDDSQSALPVEIGSESPIRTQSEDLLRRGSFAERIAKVLAELSPREGRVFAIRGGWGFGKSSLKYLVIEQLEANDEAADWLDFNAWQWGDGSAISRALFGQIADRLGGDHSRAAVARAEALRRYGAILTGAGGPLKKAGGASQLISSVLASASVISIGAAVGFDLPKAAQIAAALAFLSVLATLLGRTLSYLGRDRTGEPLDKIREALEARLRKLKRPLIVFVDDIDRLEPEQIRLLLRQVKANANLPNIVFVLLFQPSIVERALDPVADNDGRAFLEKIVQANFDLPAVSVQVVHQVFWQELKHLVAPHATEQNGFEERRWGNAMVGCILPWIRNMRDARRLLSSIAIHLPLHAPTTLSELFEVNLVDYLVLEALRVFEPNLHTTLFQERALLLQEHRYQGDGRHEEVKAAAQRLIDSVPENRRKLAHLTIKELFPTLGSALGGVSYADGYGARWLTEKRVCTPRYFPRYFELQTALGAMSDSRFEAFLDACSTEQQLTASISEAESDGLLPSLADRMSESVGRLPVEHAAVLLPAMFEIAQKFVHSGCDNFSPPYLSAWGAASYFLEKIPEADRGRLAMDALRATEALSVASLIIYLSDANEHEDGDSHFDPTLDPETVEAMKVVWLELVRRRALDVDALIAEGDLVYLLFRWKFYSGSEQEPKHWVREATQTDEGFIKIVSCMMTKSTTHVAGDRVSKVVYTFSKEAISEFIGLDLAKARSDAIESAAFPEHGIVLQSFKQHMQAWSENPRGSSMTRSQLDSL